MFKSKHSGWTWDLKRTPFGGGNPISGITDSISSALGTDGGGGGVLGALADIDPGPAIGSGLADVDKFVNNEIPGGWYTVGGLAAGGTALYFAPEIMAAMGANAGTAITTEAGKEAFFSALANGASSTQAISAGLSAEAALGGGALTTEQILSSGGFTPTGGSSFVIDPSAVYATGGSYVTPELMGPTYQELGVTGVPEGGMGPTYGELGYTGLNQNEAIAAADAVAKSGLSASDVLSNANRLKNIAKLLTGSEQSKIFGSNTPTAQQFAQFQQSQNVPVEQFGGLYESNKNPFMFQNPLASALAGNKPASGLDVSGTGGGSLQASTLAKLL